jgi:hypothetical protein
LNKRELKFQLIQGGSIQVSSGSSLSKLIPGESLKSCKGKPGSLLLPITHMLFEEQFREVFTEHVGEIPRALLSMKPDDGNGNSLTGLAGFLAFLLVPVAIYAYVEAKRKKERELLEGALEEEHQEYELRRMADADAVQMQRVEATCGPRHDVPTVRA